MRPEPHDVRLDEWRALPAETEWLEFKEAKHGFDIDDLGRYVCALANEANLLGREAGWIVFGVKNSRDAVTGLRPIVGSTFASAATQLNEVKHRIACDTAPALSLGDPVEIAHPDCPAGARVLCWRVPPAPRGMPVAWKGHYYGSNGESLGGLALHKLETIRAQAAILDWSALTVTDDWDLLDPTALDRARVLYRRRHATHPSVLEAFSRWTTEEWLRELRLATGNRLTRAALVLLGRSQAASLLGGPTPRLSWLLVDHRAEVVSHEHFELPLLTASDALVAKLRIFEVSLLPPRQTAPIVLPNYDDWVIREALHNAIAHQDYGQGGRIRVTESPDALSFFNLGAFLPGTVERVLLGRQPEHRYRNACLANAMVELDMMETINSGVPKMFRLQRERFFPLPDFELGHAPDSVLVRIHGKVLNQEYMHALMGAVELSLEDAILLDRVQKQKTIDSADARRLRGLGLIEGRAPRLRISAQVAAAMGKEVEYVSEAGLDAAYFKALVLKLLSLGPQPRSKIDGVLLGQLPGSIKGGTDRKSYVKHLLRQMAAAGEIENVGGATRAALWKARNIEKR